MVLTILLVLLYLLLIGLVLKFELLS